MSHAASGNESSRFANGRRFHRFQNGGLQNPPQLRHLRVWETAGLNPGASYSIQRIVPNPDRCIFEDDLCTYLQPLRPALPPVIPGVRGDTAQGVGVAGSPGDRSRGPPPV